MVIRDAAPKPAGPSVAEEALRILTSPQLRCYGCDMVHEKQGMNDLARKLNAELTELMNASVARLAAPRAVAAVSAFYERNMRMYTRIEWPVARIAEHMYQHCKDPAFVLSSGRALLERCVAEASITDPETGGLSHADVKSVVMASKEIRGILATSALLAGAAPRRKAPGDT
jgi:chorismate mutase